MPLQTYLELQREHADVAFVVTHTGSHPLQTQRSMEFQPHVDRVKTSALGNAIPCPKQQCTTQSKRGLTVSSRHKPSSSPCTWRSGTGTEPSTWTSAVRHTAGRVSTDSKQRARREVRSALSVRPNSET
jgi:hypothetical protein